MPGLATSIRMQTVCGSPSPETSAEARAHTVCIRFTPTLKVMKLLRRVMRRLRLRAQTAHERHETPRQAVSAAHELQATITSAEAIAR